MGISIRSSGMRFCIGMEMMDQGTRKGAGRQPFVAEDAGEPCFWTCARTRPRWEKKFAALLDRRGDPYFLPTIRRVTVSHRHRRTADVLLIPGYVFVARDCTKREFVPHQIVVRLLKPEGPAGIRQLHQELWQVWRGVESGAYLTPVEKVALGEECEIVGGPLRGIRGRYEKKGRQGRLVLLVNMLGAGVAVEVPTELVEPCSGRGP